LEGELQASSEQVSELRTKLADVRKESMTDPLTNIANRKAFDEAVLAAMAAVAEDGEAVTLLLCDIDHFKNFNDTWGHQTGDQVLRLVAHCLSENVKGRDTAARYGGEEFAVLFTGVERQSALATLEEAREAVAGKRYRLRESDEPLGAVTFSAGLTAAQPGESLGTVFGRADALLYAAKDGGRNVLHAA
jgi:diguanylate cyclase